MNKKPFLQMIQKANEEGRRIVAPLMGFPGLNMTDCTIKLAQQNFNEHFKALKALANTFSPDIIFPLMDLSVEANALGCYTIFPRKESPTVVNENIGSKEFERLDRINIAFDTRLIGYLETVKLMSISLPESIMRGAYVAGPYSLSALMIGAEKAAMATVMEPDYLTEICQMATERIQTYVRLLIAAGAQVICILEPSGVMLGPNQFEQYSAQYVRHISNSCKYTGVATVYHVCGNTMHLFKKMSQAGVDGISLDSREAGVDLPAVASQVSSEVAIVGNISPTGSIFNASPADVSSEVLSLLENMAPYPNFILSTGCDLPQETPLENIKAFMDVGRSYRLKK